MRSNAKPGPVDQVTHCTNHQLPVFEHPYPMICQSALHQEHILALRQRVLFHSDAVTCLQQTESVNVMRHFLFLFVCFSKQTLPGITFLGNCVVELYGLDMPSAYQVHKSAGIS